MKNNINADNKSDVNLVSFWEGPVSWLERLCVASALSVGNSLTIYCYDPNKLINAGIHHDVRDAREIIDENAISYRYIESRKLALFSDIFRMELQRKAQGIWVDLDCFFLKKLVSDQQYLFGLVTPKKINGAVLYLPNGSPMVTEYSSAISAVPLRTPWSSWKRRVRREFEILSGKEIPSATTQTNIGPRALSYFAHKHDKMKFAKPIDCFYPIPSKIAPVLTDSDDRVARNKVTDSTILIHAWQGKLKRSMQLETVPNPNSYLGAAYKRLQV